MPRFSTGHKSAVDRLWDLEQDGGIMFIAGIEIFFGFVAAILLLYACIFVLYAVFSGLGWIGRHLPKYEAPKSASPAPTNELNSVEVVLRKHGIPNADELDRQLSDGTVLYDVINGSRQPIELLKTLAKLGNWTPEKKEILCGELLAWTTDEQFERGEAYPRLSPKFTESASQPPVSR